MMKRAFLIVLLTLAGLAATASGALAAPEKVAGGIRFTYTDPNAGTVVWAGEFNGWNASATPLVKDDQGVWSVTIALPAGEHQYKLVVDGQWVADPENGATAGDMGNSVVRVGADGHLELPVQLEDQARRPHDRAVPGRAQPGHPALRAAPARDGHRPGL
jgi:hypothetical protein